MDRYLIKSQHKCCTNGLWTELRVKLCVQSHGPLVESVSALYKWSTGRPSVGAVQMAYW